MLSVEPPPKTFALGVEWVVTHGGSYVAGLTPDGTFLVTVGAFGRTAHAEAPASVALAGAFVEALTTLARKI